MKINYEGYINRFKSRHDPKRRGESLQTYMTIGFVMVVIILVIFYFVDKEMMIDFYHWVSMNLLYIVLVFAIIFGFIIFTVFYYAKEDKTIIDYYIRYMNDYKKISEPIVKNIESLGTFKIFGYSKKNDYYNVSKSHFYWIENQSLVFFETPPTDYLNDIFHKPCFIPISKIISYEIIGDKYYENKISGGGSEEGSLGKAIIGQAVFGTAGAIVGGQQKINPIKSEVILHDERKTKIVIENHEEGITSMFIDLNFFEVLKEMIPKKDKEIIDQISKQKLLNSQEESKEGISNRLRTLKNLFLEGVIDEKEYSERKKKIMDEL